ncbi:MAG: hypothetical protein WC516_08865 [Patescibacteria group bacterium]|nr:hypothetical protein [Sulfuricurvum sp.]
MINVQIIPELRTIETGFQNFIKDFVSQADLSVKKMADEFKIELILNITSQKFAGAFSPLSNYWENWKAEHGRPQDFWINYNYLYNAFGVTKTIGGYSVGIDENILPEQSSSFKMDRRTPIWKYLFYNEFGRGAFSKGKVSVGPQPARPVINPTREIVYSGFWNEKIKEDFQQKISEKFKGMF